MQKNEYVYYLGKISALNLRHSWVYKDYITG